MTDLPAAPQRGLDANKGDFGRVLIVGGSRGMSGAAALAGTAALRGGAGLVFVAVPQGILPIVAAHETSYLTVPLPEDAAGKISASARDVIDKLEPRPTVMAIGPGLGKSPGLVKLVGSLYDTVELPIVLDADALNLLSERGTFSSTGAVNSPPAPRILTPHPGEFARLTGKGIPEVQARREYLATEFARTHGVIVVLKGSGTVVTDGTRIAINRTGNSGMATGGTGDVLTGLIAALLGQRMTPFEAAHLGAHLHGLAGDLAAKELSQPGLIASDLPRYLPSAWRQFLAPHFQATRAT